MMTPEEALRRYNREIDACAYKEHADCTPGEVLVRKMERDSCIDSFSRFLRWCKLIEAPTPLKPGGVIQVELWPHIVDIVNCLLDPQAPLLSMLKARQVGASWIISDYVTWHALTHEGSLWILFSKGEEEAIALLDKCKAIYDHLPPFMKLTKGGDSKTELSFPIMNSHIFAKPATESAGVSYQCSGIIMDEAQDMEYAQKIFLNSKPCIDQWGGQYIIIFTSPKPDLNKLCVHNFRQAMKGTNGFKPMFIPYTARPGRDEKWYTKTLKQASMGTEGDLDGLSPELYMERTYPRSVEEALSETSAVSAFDHKVLDEMMGETKNPITDVPEGIDPKLVHIYQKWNLGELYIAGSDTSHGIGKDYSVTCVMNARTGTVVADIMHNRLHENDFGYHSLKLMEVYHNPLWYIEDNDWGRVIISIAERANYRHLGYADKNKTKAGYHTTGGESGRTLLWGTLLPAINTHQITIFNPEGIKQFRSVIRNSEKNGRIEAAKGGNDDYPIAVGICWLKREEVKTPVYEYKPIETLQFRR